MSAGQRTLLSYNALRAALWRVYGTCQLAAMLQVGDSRMLDAADVYDASTAHLRAALCELEMLAAPSVAHMRTWALLQRELAERALDAPPSEPRPREAASRVAPAAPAHAPAHVVQAAETPIAGAASDEQESAERKRRDVLSQARAAYLAEQRGTRRAAAALRRPGAPPAALPPPMPPSVHAAPPRQLPAPPPRPRQPAASPPHLPPSPSPTHAAAARPARPAEGRRDSPALPVPDSRPETAEEGPDPLAAPPDAELVEQAEEWLSRQAALLSLVKSELGEQQPLIVQHAELPAATEGDAAEDADGAPDERDDGEDALVDAGAPAHGERATVQLDLAPAEDQDAAPEADACQDADVTPAAGACLLLRPENLPPPPRSAPAARARPAHAAARPPRSTAGAVLPSAPPARRRAGDAAGALRVDTSRVDYSAHYASFEHIFTAFAPVPGEQRARGRPDARLLADLYRSTADSLDAWCAHHADELAADALPAPWPALARTAGVRWYRCSCSSHEEVDSIVARALSRSQDGEWRREDSTASSSSSAASLAGLWNLLWTWSSSHRPPRPQELLVWQRCNHFAAIKALTRKDLLKRHVEAARTAHGAALFDIMPQTFQLPAEYVPFVDAFTRAQQAQQAQQDRAASLAPAPPLWIMKPIGLSRGRGIFLVDDLSQVEYGETYVVQKYVDRPLLLDGHKMDLRLYVLVTSFAPTEAFIYSEGFARVSTERYRASDCGNLRMHLTNYSVQRAGAGASAVPAPLQGVGSSAAGGSKCSLSHLWGALRARGVDDTALWARACDVVRKSLSAVHCVIPQQPNAFELLGYDVIFDAALRPWLLEVNSSPSLEADHPLDEEIKGRMLRDALAILQPPAFDRAQLAQVLRRRAGGGARSARGSDGSGPLGTCGDGRDALNADLHAVLGGAVPRRLGEAPQAPGLFQRLAPSPEWDALLLRKKQPTRRT